MMPQSDEGESIREPAHATYGRYEEELPYARPPDGASDEHLLKDEAGGKAYPPLSEKQNKLRLQWFAVAMVALLAFAVVCLVIVGGTAGWISFLAASFTIMVIASTAISTMK
jgi:hypothetical protein